MSMTKPKHAVALALALACAAAPAVRAQEAWPTRNVRFLVAFAPGGIGDIIGRFVGQALGEKWGHAAIIENRGGGGGNIGAAMAARAEPDGYTVLVTTSSFTVNLSLYDNPGYAFPDFRTAGVAAISPNIIVAPPGSRYNTLPEFLAAAKTGAFSFGSAGVGTTPHLTGEMIFRLLGKVDVRHAPFTGAGPAVVAAMGGHVQVAVVALPAAIEQVKSGTLKALAVTTKLRLPDLPNVPTVKETGVGDVETATMVAFFMPAKTPPAIVAKFNADLNAAIASGVLDKPFASAGVDPLTLDVAQAGAFVADEIQKWAAVVKAANIKPE